MSQNQVAVISCDHENCTEQNQVQSRISTLQPFYHLKLEISTIDAKGTVCLVSIDKDVCRWDCWSEISKAHDFVTADLEVRKALFNEMQDWPRDETTGLPVDPRL